MFDVKLLRSIQRSLFIALSVLLLTTACENGSIRQAGYYYPDEDQGNVRVIEFLDSQTFDRKVSRELANSPRTTVVAVNDQIPLSQLPARLDNWLSAVDKDGGAVEVKAESSGDDKSPKTRSMLAVAGIAFSAISKISEYMKESIYDPARNYDATVYYRLNDGGVRVIASVVFTRKK